MRFRLQLASVRGQATVEFVLLLPLLAVIGAVVWQLVVVGQAVWLGGSAARAAARAVAVGDSETEVRRAATAQLPGYLEHHIKIRRGEEGGEDDGTVRVTLAVPTLLSEWTLTEISARAHFEPQGGGA